MGDYKNLTTAFILALMQSDHFDQKKEGEDMESEYQTCGLNYQTGPAG